MPPPSAPPHGPVLVPPFRVVITAFTCAAAGQSGVIQSWVRASRIGGRIEQRREVETE